MGKRRLKKLEYTVITGLRNLSLRMIRYSPITKHVLAYSHRSTIVLSLYSDQYLSLVFSNFKTHRAVSGRRL